MAFSKDVVLKQDVCAVVFDGDVVVPAADPVFACGDERGG
eukprot:CAMPEP_0197867746 /NCGR_PEP_ID=MMETSP1438-20131217/44915_1 /TAXON_ID=1461541 /ORGANISM="Pterosperma sp., Strain CCMP1384" /LENGTH=39 /DNA_ID= /DNA_START= /DNA_END= /DNA_ORIENTATION=